MLCEREEGGRSDKRDKDNIFLTNFHFHYFFSSRSPQWNKHKSCVEDNSVILHQLLYPFIISGSSFLWDLLKDFALVHPFSGCELIHTLVPVSFMSILDKQLERSESFLRKERSEFVLLIPRILRIFNLNSYFYACIFYSVYMYFLIIIIVIMLTLRNRKRK